MDLACLLWTLIQKETVGEIVKIEWALKSCQSREAPKVIISDYESSCGSMAAPRRQRSSHYLSTPILVPPTSNNSTSRLTSSRRARLGWQGQGLVGDHVDPVSRWVEEAARWGRWGCVWVSIADHPDADSESGWSEEDLTRMYCAAWLLVEMREPGKNLLRPFPLGGIFSWQGHFLASPIHITGSSQNRASLLGEIWYVSFSS